MGSVYLSQVPFSHFLITEKYYGRYFSSNITMKVIGTLCLVGSAYAGMRDMMKLADNLKRHATNSTSASVRSFASAWGSRIIESIDGYACWCYFQDDHGKGRGKPVNEMDARCKVLQDGYTCIMMDADDEGNDNESFDEGCIPWDV